MPPAFTSQPFHGHTCPFAPGEGIVPAQSLRRLGRAQELALTVCSLACKPSPPPGERTATFVGTGMGESGSSARFLHDILGPDPLPPRPLDFINAVHNSIASETAVVLGLKGENCTFTHDAVSFELALSRAAYVLQRGKMDRVLVCGVDALTPFAAVLGPGYGWWSDDAASPRPILGALGTSRAAPGEGAGAFLLARAEDATEAEALARLLVTAVRPLPEKNVAACDPREEVAFIQATLARAGVSLGEIGFVLLGANGNPAWDAVYANVMAELAKSLPEKTVCGVYKHRCGEFHTAPALGLALAVDIVQTGTVPETIACVAPPRPDRPIATVLLYHVTASGYHSVCVVAS
ncbi:MAG TPA: beta-ketoacyl synthase N-terminal-like domain-containing protein [Candidatus Hydrogenedentes bacterium]|nr:beta-ketoacyl synthase N-terminal-like domain-containing protein [Candidatus Hydrogenedentota bacterium]